MTKTTLVYLLEYPISNWVKDEIDEIKNYFSAFHYTTIGNFYKNYPDSLYFYPNFGNYVWAWIQVFTFPFKYFPLLTKYRKEVGLRIIIQSITLGSFLKKQKNLRLHCHFASSSTTVALILYQLYGYPFGFTAHAWDIYFKTVNLTLLRQKLISAYYVRTISEYNKTYLVSISPESQSKIHVIHCGVRIGNFSVTLKSLNKESITIISASNLVEKKGYIPFIESFKEIEVSKILFKWKIAGQGPLKGHIEQTIRNNGLEKYIEVITPVPHNQLIDFFNTADIFFIPCTISSNGDRDGIPVILMEAMASGIITISTTVSGIAELINNKMNGFLLEQNNANELLNTINYIKQLPESDINSIRNTARNTIEEKFNITKIVNEHLDLI